MGSAPFNYASWLDQSPAGGQNYQYAPNYQPNWATSDPAKADQNNWVYDAAQGQQINNSIEQQQNYAQQLQNYYRTPMDQAAGQLAQTPGYTSQETQNIARGPQYQSGETTAAQYNAMAPTGAQQSAMYGDPNSLYGWFDPKQSQGIDYQSAASQRGDLGTAKSSLTSALGSQKAGYDNAIDPSQLTLEPGYAEALQGAYSGGSANVESAVNSPNLQLNLDPNQYLMSNQQLQDTVNQAGQSVQLARQSQQDQYQKQALASGNADPMALAALSNQTQQQANESSANAETNAYLQARGQQSQLAMNYAQAQLGAGQTQAGMQSSAGQNLLAQQLGMETGYEGMRIGAQQGLTADQMNAVQAENASRMGSAEYLGSTGIGMEQGIGSQAANTQQYLTNTGTGIASQVNALNTGYANQQYQNQLQNQMYQQQNTFNQNTAVQDRQSAAYQAAANARMGGQNQFLNWSTGQTGQAVGMGQTAQQQQIGLYGTQAGAMNQAAGQWGNYALGKSSQPSPWMQGIGAAAGAAMAFA